MLFLTKYRTTNVAVFTLIKRFVIIYAALKYDLKMFTQTFCCERENFVFSLKFNSLHNRINKAEIPQWSSLKSTPDVNESSLYKGRQLTNT